MIEESGGSKSDVPAQVEALQKIAYGEEGHGPSHRMYQDSSHYPEVARINNLDGFRQLEPGMQLVFPPLKADDG